MRKKESITITVPYEFNLKHIFECGQCFRWNKIPAECNENLRHAGNGAGDDPEKTDPAKADPDTLLCYTGIAYGKRVTMTQRMGVRGALNGDVEHGPHNELEISPCTKEEFDTIWYDYLDLGRDYGKIRSTLSKDDPMMRRAADFGYGIRILKQDLWEMIISFIISQNSNIPRIKGCIERLCEVAANKSAEVGRTAGITTVLCDGTEQSSAPAPEPFPGHEALSVSQQYPFPGPEAVARLTEEDLAPVRLGYRQKYIMKVAGEICERGMPETEEDLLALNGVGPKVAACISLFGLGNTASFPIDTWVKQVMHALYGFEQEDMAGMAKFAGEHFGELGGFAQQYLFYYMRETGG